MNPVKVDVTECSVDGKGVTICWEHVFEAIKFVARKVFQKW